MFPQEPSLFHTSIRKNLDIHKQYSDTELINELAPYHLFDFIRERNLLEMNLGSKRVNLSGGQPQRIAIARALLKKAPII